MPLNKETKPKDLLGETWGGSFSLFLVIYIYIYIYIYFVFLICIKNITGWK